jgi:hypothetical protein
VDSFRLVRRVGTIHHAARKYFLNGIYCLYRLLNVELTMIEPRAGKATKKAAHFPKHANGHAVAEERQADAPEAVATDSEAAPAKAKKQKRVVPVEAAPTEIAVAEKAQRQKKEKVVRDSFTMPKSDYEKIAALKQKCLGAGVSVKKSELLRAGLVLLETASMKRLLEAISAVETVKTGRPAKS